LSIELFSFKRWPYVVLFYKIITGTAVCNPVICLVLLQEKNMVYNKHIVRNPGIMLGKPIIRGTRITVELIMRKLAGGYIYC